jgi:hypothetical protein
MDRTGKEFLQEIAKAISTAPVSVQGGPQKMHAVFFAGPDRSRLTVALVNDFSWVFTGRTRTRDGQPIPGVEEQLNRQPPPPCQGVRVLLRTDRRPRNVRELATGRNLEPTATSGGYFIDVPTFDCTAVLHIRM